MSQERHFFAPAVFSFDPLRLNNKLRNFSYFDGSYRCIGYITTTKGLLQQVNNLVVMHWCNTIYRS